jgi:hypothetical protein
MKIKISKYSCLLLILASRVSITKKDTLTPDEITKLEGLYKQMLRPAIDIYRKDKAERGRRKF